MLTCFTAVIFYCTRDLEPGTIIFGMHIHTSHVVSGTVQKLAMRLCKVATYYRIAGKLGGHYIWRFQPKRCAFDFKFGDSVPQPMSRHCGV